MKKLIIWFVLFFTIPFSAFCATGDSYPTVSSFTSSMSFFIWDDSAAGSLGNGNFVRLPQTSSGAVFKLLYEAEADTNAFTDAYKDKIDGIESNAKDDQTGTEIISLIDAILGTEWKTGGAGDDLGNASFSDVVALWSACSGYLKSDGNCDIPSGIGDMTISVYDPTGVNGDAFNMENMVEGATKKILTQTERNAFHNIYQHPANHDPSIITQDAFNRFVTDAQIDAWNAKLGSYSETDPVFSAWDKSYTDLINKPTLGNSASKDVGTTADTVAAGDDSRFHDPVDISGKQDISPVDGKLYFLKDGILQEATIAVRVAADLAEAPQTSYMVVGYSVSGACEAGIDVPDASTTTSLNVWSNAITAAGGDPNFNLAWRCVNAPPIQGEVSYVASYATSGGVSADGAAFVSGETSYIAVYGTSGGVVAVGNINIAGETSQVATYGTSAGVTVSGLVNILGEIAQIKSYGTSATVSIGGSALAVVQDATYPLVWDNGNAIVEFDQAIQDGASGAGWTINGCDDCPITFSGSAVVAGLNGNSRLNLTETNMVGGRVDHDDTITLAYNATTGDIQPAGGGTELSTFTGMSMYNTSKQFREGFEDTLANNGDGNTWTGEYLGSRTTSLTNEGSYGWCSLSYLESSRAWVRFQLPSGHGGGTISGVVRLRTNGGGANSTGDTIEVYQSTNSTLEIGTDTKISIYTPVTLNPSTTAWQAWTSTATNDGGDYIFVTYVDSGTHGYEGCIDSINYNR